MADNEGDELRPPAAGLPPGLESCRRSDTLCERTPPRRPAQAHATRPGIWGLIQVTEGELRYRLEDDRRIPAKRRLRAGLPPGVVEPTILHSVEPAGPVRFHVEFFRGAAPPL